MELIKTIHTTSGKRLKIYRNPDYPIENVLEDTPGNSGFGEVKVLNFNNRHVVGHNQIQDTTLEGVSLLEVLENVTGIENDDEFRELVKKHILESVKKELEEDLHPYDLSGEYGLDQEVAIDLVLKLAQERELAMVQRLHLYEHGNGNVAIWTSPPNQLNCDDEMAVGYVVTDLSEIKKHLSKDENLLAYAEKHANSYIKLLDAVCQGQVFSVRLEEPKICPCCSHEASANGLDFIVSVIGEEKLKGAISDLCNLTSDEFREIQSQL